MKTRIVHTKIWTDQFFVELSRAGKLLFLYILTCPENNISGCFELPDRKMLFDTGLNNTELEQAKVELNTKVSFIHGWVVVHNSTKYQQYKGPKNEKARQKELELTPPLVKDTLSIPYRYPIDSTRNQKSEIRNKKPEINDVQKFLELFDEVRKTSYAQRSSASILKNYTHWRSIYSLEEMVQAVKNAKSHAFWDEAITPTTLLRTRNKNGPCDNIGDLLNTKTKNSLKDLL